MRAYFAVLAAWATAIGVIYPVGNFPLNDDWAFALPVKWLVEKGTLSFTDWQYMSLIGQVLLAWPVAAVTGFSFDVLRLLVLVLALGTALAIVSWSLEKGLGELYAALLALTFVLNPIALNLASTFMTDVPFTAALTASVIFLDRSHRRGSPLLLALGWASVLLACAIRQLGLAVAMAYLIASFPGERSKSAWLRRALIPAVASLLLVIIYPRALDHFGILPSMYATPLQNLKLTLVKVLTLKLGTIRQVLQAAIIALTYWSLALFPLVICWTARDMAAKAFARQAALVTASAALTLGLVGTGHLFPFALNIFFDFGLGPLTLDGGDAHTGAWPGFRLLLTFIACYSGVAVAYAMCALLAHLGSPRHWQVTRDDFSIWFVGLSLGLYMAPLLLILPWFDRYLVPALALGLLLIALLVTRYLPSYLGTNSVYAVSASALSLVVFGLFGAAGTHDYIAMNRERWILVDSVLKSGLANKEGLDGGFEVNNYLERLNGDMHRPAGSVSITRSDAHFLVSLRSDVPGYALLSSSATGALLASSPQRIHLLRRRS